MCIYIGKLNRFFFITNGYIAVRIGNGHKRNEDVARRREPARAGLCDAAARGGGVRRELAPLAHARARAHRTALEVHLIFLFLSLMPESFSLCPNQDLYEILMDFFVFSYNFFLQVCLLTFFITFFKRNISKSCKKV